MRFLPQYIIPKELVNSKAYGGLKSMHVNAGNFGLAMNAIHYFEAFRFLTDESPSLVTAWLDKESLPNPRGDKFSDVSGSVRVTTKTGRRLYIDASSDQGHGVQVTYMTRNGRITVDELTGSMKTVLRQEEFLSENTSRYGLPVECNEEKIPAIELLESTKAVQQALIEGVNYPSLEDAITAVKTLVAAYHSEREGNIAIPLSSIDDKDSEVFPWA